VATGHADSTAISAASNGGRAVAHSVANGRRNGYATSTAVALADRGLAVSNSRADALGAYGGFATADSESVAATIGGVAISNSDAISDGRLAGVAHSRSTSTALSRFGYADSDSRAISHGYLGGHAVSRSDSIADTFGGVARSRVLSDSEAGFQASADADGVGIAVSGPRRNSTVQVLSISRGFRYGHDRSSASAIELRP
jgi:hypothetical protein